MGAQDQLPTEQEQVHTPTDPMAIPPFKGREQSSDAPSVSSTDQPIMMREYSRENSSQPAPEITKPEVAETTGSRRESESSNMPPSSGPPPLFMPPPMMTPMGMGGAISTPPLPPITNMSPLTMGKRPSFDAQNSVAPPKVSNFSVNLVLLIVYNQFRVSLPLKSSDFLRSTHNLKKSSSWF